MSSQVYDIKWEPGMKYQAEENAEWTYFILKNGRKEYYELASWEGIQATF